MKWFKNFLIAVIAASFIAVNVQAATLRSDLETNRAASPPTMNNPNIDGANIKRIRATYVFTGSEATGDVIEMARMPYKAIVIRELSTIEWETMGTTVVAEVGDADDPNRYCSSLNMEGPSGTAVRTTFQEAFGTNTYYSANEVGTSTTTDTVDVTLTTVSTPTSGANLTIEVVYASIGG